MVKLVSLQVISLKVAEAVDGVSVFVSNLGEGSHPWLHFRITQRFENTGT